MKISATLACSEIIKNNKNIYNFGLGANPLIQPNYYIEQMKKNCVKKEYTSCSGIDNLQNILKKKFSNENYKVNNLLVGNGLKELLYIIQMAFDGKIFHIVPSWVSYYEQIKLLGRENDLIQIETNIKDNYKINLDLLDKELGKFKNEKKMIIFNNPNNPLGIMYLEEEVRKISNILKKHNVLVVADEIYLNLHHFNKFKSISYFLPNNTIRCSSVSKDLACGGYRLGWATFPKNISNFFEKCNSYSSSIYSCANTVCQYASYKMLNNEIILNEFFNFNNIIYKFIVEEIDKILKKSKIKYVKPNSSWYIFLNFDNYTEIFKRKNIENSYDLCKFLLDELSILCVAGESFNIQGLNLRFSLIDININELYKYDNPYLNANLSLIMEKDRLIIKKIIDGITLLVNYLNELEN